MASNHAKNAVKFQKRFYWAIFCLVMPWVISVITLGLKPTHKSAELDIYFLAVCFGVSMCGFVIGWASVALFGEDRQLLVPNIEWTFVKSIGYCGFLILVYNIYESGWPPIFKVFGFDAVGYNLYGRFKGVYFPILGTLILIGVVSWRDSWMYCMAGIMGLLLYFSRGPLIVYVVQALLLLFLSRRFNGSEKLRLLTIGVSVIFITNGLLGNLRSGSDGLNNQMGVSERFNEFGSLLNWTASYLATPLSNFVHIKDCGSEGGANFLFRILPAFLHEKLVLKCGNTKSVIDDAHFYLFYWYLWIGFKGIFLVNFIYGMFVAACRFNIVYMSIALSVLIFSFFGDMLFQFQTIIQLMLIRLCFRDVKKV